MNEAFCKWIATKNIDEYGLMHGLTKDDWEWQLAKAAFDAGADAMRYKAAEVASNYPTNTKMMVIGSGLIAGAIRRLEVN